MREEKDDSPDLCAHPSTGATRGERTEGKEEKNSQPTPVCSYCVLRLSPPCRLLFLRLGCTTSGDSPNRGLDAGVVDRSLVEVYVHLHHPPHPAGPLHLLGRRSATCAATARGSTEAGGFERTCRERSSSDELFSPR